MRAPFFASLLCVRLAWLASKPLSVIMLLLVPLILFLSTLLGYWQKLAVDAVVAGDRSLAVTAGLLLTASLVLGSLVASQTARARFRLEQAVARELETRVVAAVLEAEDDAALLTPSVADKLELLQGQQIRLGHSLSACFLLLAAMAPALATLALLVTVHPVLSLIFVPAAVEIAVSSRNTGRQTAREDALAGPLRTRRHLMDLLTGPAHRREIAANRAGGWLGGRLDRKLAEIFQQRQAVLWSNTVRAALAKLLFAAFLAGLTFWVLRGIQQGRLTAGDLVLAFSAMRRASLDLALLTGATDFWLRRMQLVTRLLWVEEHVGRVRGRPDAGMGTTASAEAGPAGLVVDGVTLRYPGSAEDTLKGVSFTAAAGAVTAIVGPNGAGKSTLIRAIAGGLRPQSGSITLRHPDGAAQRYWTVAAVMQPYVRLRLTLRDAVDPARRAGPSGLASALRTVGLEHVWPAPRHGHDGPDLNPFTGGRDLSDGQWQRLAIARAVLQLPAHVLVLDEPTAALDSLAEDAVLAAIQTIADDARRNGLVVLLVCHRLSLAARSNRIVVLSAGRLHEQGTFAQLMSHDGEFARLYRLQAEGFHEPCADTRKDEA